MAVNTMNTWPDLVTPQTGRGLSKAIWGDCPIVEIEEDCSVGMLFFDDFLNQPNVAAGAQALYGNYYGFASTGGSATEPTQAAGAQLGGIKVLSSGSDNDGVSIQTVSKPFEIDRTNNGRKFWFEARIQTSTIADTKHDIFLGLIENCTLSATVPITAAGALADQNMVGFFRPETSRSGAGTGGAIMNVVYKANGVTAVTLAQDAVALTAGTWVKLGMTFSPSKSQPGKWYLQFYANGVEIVAAQYQVPTAQGTDFPNDVGLGPVFAIVNATGSSPGSSQIDWWQMAQLF